MSWARCTTHSPCPFLADELSFPQTSTLWCSYPPRGCAPSSPQTDLHSSLGKGSPKGPGAVSLRTCLSHAEIERDRAPAGSWLAFATCLLSIAAAAVRVNRVQHRKMTGFPLRAEGSVGLCGIWNGGCSQLRSNGTVIGYTLPYSLPWS